METVETPQPVQPTESKAADWTKIILAVVLGFVLLAGAAYGGYYYGTQQVQPIEKPTPVVSQPIPTSKPTPTPIPIIENGTTDWKTYEGVTVYSGRFSVKYPSGWALKRMVGDAGKGDLLFPLGDINADIINYKAPYVLLGAGGHGGRCEKQTRTFTAGKAEYCWGEFGGEAVFNKNNVPYILEAYYYGDPQTYTNEQYKIVFDQILSTFKFLD